MFKTSKEWTYGVEHELADWDTTKKLPKEFTRADDWTLVNSNGIAVPPNSSHYQYGGEINTPPTFSVEGQVDCLERILKRYPKAAVNYRSNLHIHIRVPGLIDSLPQLKRLQRYIHKYGKEVVQRIEPIPKSVDLGSRKREKRRKVSHQTFLLPHRVEKQCTATSLKEFFELEVPMSKKGQVMWHAQPRLAINLRQLLQTNTIEFRHFPGTLSSKELRAAISWCRDFLLSIETPHTPIDLLENKYAQVVFPKFALYDFETEVKYQATAYHNELKTEEIARNRELILQGKFNGKVKEKAIARASGLSWKHLP